MPLFFVFDLFFSGLGSSSASDEEHEDIEEPTLAGSRVSIMLVARFLSSSLMLRSAASSEGASVS
eukprot:4413306-Prymnesium_polylepis.2